MKRLLIRLIVGLIVVGGCTNDATVKIDTVSSQEKTQIAPTQGQAADTIHINTNPKPWATDKTPQTPPADPVKTEEVKKRVKFSESFLKELPDIYKDLGRLNAPGKFIIFHQITGRQKREYFQDKVTNEDMANLIEEILLDGGQELIPAQKEIIIGISAGRGPSFKDDDLYHFVQGSWHTRIPEAAPYIMKLLKDKDIGVRRSAAYAMGNLVYKKAIPELSNLLRDKNLLAQASAAVSLANLGAKEFIPEVINLLNSNDIDDGERPSIITALRIFNAKESAPELIKQLSNGKYGINVSAACLLGVFGDKEAIPELIKLLDDKYNFARGWAAISLVELGAKDKVPKRIISDIKDILDDVRNYGHHYYHPDSEVVETRARAALKTLGVEIEENK